MDEVRYRFAVNALTTPEAPRAFVPPSMASFTPAQVASEVNTASKGRDPKRSVRRAG